MSRVIKAAQWEEKPHLVAVKPFVPPEPKKKPEPSEADKRSSSEEDFVDLTEEEKKAAKEKTLEDERISAHEKAMAKAAAIIADAEAEAKEKINAAEEEVAKAKETVASLEEAIASLEKKAADLEAKLKEDEAASAAKISEAEKTAQEKKEEAEKFLEDARLKGSLIEAKAQEEKRLLLEEAKTKAEADAKNLAEEATKKGHDEGYSAGHAQGIEEAKKEQQEAINNANSLAEKTIADAKEEKNRYLVEAEEQIVGMVLRIADKILPQHFIDAPQVILPLVKEAIKKVKDQPEIIVKVAPSQYDLLLLAKMEFQSLLEGQATLEVKSDESLAISDCVIETPSGNVDARLSVQLETVKNAVLSQLSTADGIV